MYPYGGGGSNFGFSYIPSGPFQQFGQVTSGLGQQAQAWLPAIMQQREQAAQNQANMAIQAYTLAEQLDPNATPENRRRRALQLQDTLSNIPGYKGFKIPTVPVAPQAPQAPTPPPTGQQQAPLGIPSGVPGVPQPMATPPPFPGSPTAIGAPPGQTTTMDWRQWRDPSTGPQPIPNAVPGPVQTVPLAQTPPGGPAAPPTPTPTPTAGAPTPTPTPTPAAQAPGAPTEQIAVSQNLGARTPRELWGVSNPARLARLQQMTGTPDILDQPSSQVQKMFPNEWAQAMAELPGGSIADYMQQSGVVMSPQEQKAFAAIPLSSPSFQTGGIYDQAKVMDFAQRFQTYGAEAAIRGLQVKREELGILSEQQRMLYASQKQSYDDLTQRYAGAVMQGDLAKADRVLALAPNQQLSADIVRLQGDAMVTDLQSKQLIPVQGPSGRWYTLPQKEAFTGDYQAARLKNEQAGLTLRGQEYKLAQQRFATTELGTEIKIDQALEKAQNLTPADTQVLTFLRSPNFQFLPDAEKQKLAERGAAIMRSKMGVNVLPDDFFTPKGKTPTEQQAAGQGFAQKLLAAGLRKIGINIAFLPAQGATPQQQQPPLTVPALGGGPVTPLASQFYRAWLETRQPISAQTWAKLDPATKRQLDNAGVGHP